MLAINPPSKPVRNISWGLTYAEQRRNKLIVYGSVAMIAGLFGVALVWPKDVKAKKKGPGVVVDASCSGWNVTDQQAMNNRIRQLIQKHATAGVVDPFAVAHEFMREAAKHCRSYPSDAGTPQEAKLFVVVMNTVLTILMQEKLIGLEQLTTFTNMLKIWAVAQGVPPEELS